MVNKNSTYFFLSSIILFQATLVFWLFNRSLQIDGDILSYLKIMANGTNTDFVIEPFSIIIFRIIGIFPEYLHFAILYVFICFLCAVESWIIFKFSNNSFLWLLYFTLAILPFFHAINLRTGFGMFFLFLFFNYKGSIYFAPFFHASYFPLILGIRIKLSAISIFAVTLAVFFAGLVLYSLVAVKLETYIGYYNEEGSSLGVLVEILLLFIFTYLFLKNYDYRSNIHWLRILIFVLLIAFLSYKIAIISSRFVTLAYLILMIIRLQSKKKITKESITLNYFLFLVTFFALVAFRVYRVTTMFGIT